MWRQYTLSLSEKRDLSLKIQGLKVDFLESFAF